MKSKIMYGLAGIAVAVSGTILATTTVPYTFSAGQTARASDVNANFSALANGINAVDTRVTALEQATTATTGLKIVRVSANHPEFGPFTTARVECPANTVVIGGGCQDYARSIPGYQSNPSSRLIESYPDTATSWQCNSGINNGSSGNALMRAYAICLQATPASTLTTEDQTVPNPS